MRQAIRSRMSTMGFLGAGLMAIAAAEVVDTSLALASPADKTSETTSDLVIHEWGTFLGMSGSDGAALDGMYHEEHALPPFVHSRSRDQLRMPGIFLKGETPVIYFYTEKAQPVRIGVSFPRGVWTQWYPQAARVAPMLSEHATSPDHFQNGRICWTANIIPREAAEQALRTGRGAAPKIPATTADTLWNHARNVDAAYVECPDATKDPAVPEYERFLFYRGLGEAHLPVRLEERDGGTITVDRDPIIQDGVSQVFVLRVERGRAAYRYLPRLASEQSVSGVIPSLAGSLPLVDFTKAIANDLTARLTESGLFAKEARAMVNTWTSSYFQTEGVRALFVLPHPWTDAFIPMSVEPRPKQVVRVMVGRLELLTAYRERQAEAAVEGLADPDVAIRDQAYAFLRDQGRYVEPILRRVLKTTKQEPVRVLCRRLLTTDLVTELRAAVHSAADGTRLVGNPFELRAQLARLLREIGLDREARAHGVAILNALKQGPEHPAEVKAAALEASGLDRAAAAAYEACIVTSVGSYRGKLHPANVAWFRDWWMGRAYARSLARAGTLGEAIVAIESKLAIIGPSLTEPEDRVARVKLAYLRTEQGQADAANTLWASVEEGPRLAGTERLSGESELK